MRLQSLCSERPRPSASHEREAGGLWILFSLTNASGALVLGQALPQCLTPELPGDRGLAPALTELTRSSP